MQTCSNQRILANVLYGLGLLALLLQLISCFFLPWMTYDIEENIPYSKDQNTLRSTSISIGLWTVKACVTKSYLYSFETSCGSMKTAEFIHAIDASNRSATVKGKSLSIIKQSLTLPHTTYTVQCMNNQDRRLSLAQCFVSCEPIRLPNLTLLCSPTLMHTVAASPARLFVPNFSP